MDRAERETLLRETVVRVARRCPRMVARCYWSGTSAIALEELGHRESFDLDFHTQTALADTRPFLAELKRSFPGKIGLLSAPDAFGSGFSGTLSIRPGVKITLQVFAGFEDVSDEDLVVSSTAPPLRRITLRRYLANKVQCVVERIEARDMVDINAVLRAHPELEAWLHHCIRDQDAVLMAERLLGWTDTSIRDDLRSHADIDPAEANADTRSIAHPDPQGKSMTHRFALPEAKVLCVLEGGTRLDVPVFSGILKHPSTERLPELLTDPVVLRKYTCLALQKARWSVLRSFSPQWLIRCLPLADLPPGRRAALEFLLLDSPAHKTVG